MKNILPKPISPLQGITFALILTTRLLIGSVAWSNNIAVSNIVLTSQNVASHYTLVQFDLSWDNSWRNSISGTGLAVPYNWDAAWVFIKYRVQAASGGDGLWKQAWLNDTGHTAPAGSTITAGLLTPGTAFNSTTNPGMGVFIYRDANGTGTFSKQGVQLRWNYSTNYMTGSTPIDDNNTVDIQIFAIEMVYVPTGNFYVGSGGTEVGSFCTYPTTTNPFLISSEALINVGTTTNWLNYDSSSSYRGDGFGPIPATFPKGYAAFYCLKYEITQQQYVDFLNTLTFTQQASRTANAPTSVAGTGALITNNTYRCGIDIMTPGVNSSTPAVYACNLNGNTTYNEATDGQNIACNYLMWSDLTAYLDWSGLRPMTEMEYEKACRGTLAPVPNEYAWGNTNIASVSYTINNSGMANENIATNYSSAAGNSANPSATTSFINGPVRVGIFAGNSGNTGRISSGATYYGIMEMSDNLVEQTVTVGQSAGRSFTGIHGNGTLDTSGNADASNWPPQSLSGGHGQRGGDWYGSDPNNVSDRGLAAYGCTSRQNCWGGRGIRLAP